MEQGCPIGQRPADSALGSPGASRALAEQRYEAILRTAMDGFNIVDGHGALLEVSDAYCRLTGYTRDELLTMTIGDLDALDTPDETARHIAQIKSLGRQRFETRLKCKDDSIIDVEMSVDYRKEDDWFFTFVRDITERKEAEARMRLLSSDVAQQTHLSQVFMESIPAVALLLRPETREIVAANRMARAVGAVPGKTCFETWAHSDCPCPWCLAPEVWATGKAQDLEFAGQGRIWDAHWVPVADDLYLHYAFDITERKRAEEKLHSLSEIARQSLESLIQTDTEFRITYVNPAAEELYGWTLDELKGKSPDLFNVDPLADEIQRGVYASVSSGQPYSGEALNRRKDGSTFVCQFRVSPLVDAAGEIVGYLGWQRDITEQRRAQEDVRQQRDFAEGLIDTAPMIVLVLDTAGRILRFNRYMEEISGYPLEEVKGQEWFATFLPKRDIDRIREVFERAKGGIATNAAVNSIVTKNGVERQIEWYDRTLMDIAGNVTGLLSVGQDITERKADEQRLREHEDALRALASELAMTEERQRRELASRLHDRIGQSLVVARIKLENLKRPDLPREVNDGLDEVAGLIGRTIEDTGTLTFELCPPVLYDMGLEPAIAWVVEEFAREYGMQITFSDDGQPKPLNDDLRALVYRMTRELLMNTAKHARAGAVEVAMRLDENTIVVSVSDDGVGFDEERTPSRRGAAGGFGLFSIRERLKHLGGQVDIESALGQGARVTLTVPLQDASLPMSE